MVREISVHLRDTRYHLGLSQEEFGRLLGVSARTVMRWEQGARLPNQHQSEILSKLNEIKSFPEKDYLRKAIMFGGTVYGLYKLLQLSFKDKDDMRDY
jgi:transcriptional regulator with XRE-family HTH domain